MAPNLLNSLAPGRSECDSKNLTFNLVLLISIFRSSHALLWMPQDLTYDKSTLVQVMAWCCQATSHYLSQCWPRSMSPNGITRLQCVNDSSAFGLTHWGRMTHICVSKLTIIGHLGTYFSEILIEIQTFSFKKCIWNVVWKMAAILFGPQCAKLGHGLADMSKGQQKDTIIYTWQNFCLAHGGWDKMAAIFWTTLSNVFSWIKIHKFRSRSISLKFVPKGPINNIRALVMDNGLSPDQCFWLLVYWRIYVILGHNELTTSVKEALRQNYALYHIVLFQMLIRFLNLFR